MESFEIATKLGSLDLKRGYIFLFFCVTLPSKTQREKDHERNRLFNPYRIDFLLSSFS